MRLIIWTLGSIFMAIGVVQLVIEGMFAAFGGSWTRLLTLRDLSALLSDPARVTGCRTGLDPCRLGSLPG